MIVYDRVFGHSETLEAIKILYFNYNKILRIGSIGYSTEGRELPLISVGSGKKRILYVGTHHGTEHITCNLLLNYAQRLCSEKRIGRALINYILTTRTIDIIPMLNPDGALIAQSGLRWQANARGVDLNHNYNAGFAEYKRIESEAGITGGCAGRYSGEYPESEDETEALCAYIRAQIPEVLVCLHTQGGEIYYGYEKILPRGTYAIASRMANKSNYILSFPEKMASYGGCKDWFTLEFDRPGITVECGFGENPLPPEDFYKIYNSLEKALTEAAL